MAAYKAFYGAGKHGDIEGMKQGLSQNTLSLMTENAEKEGLTLDEAIKRGMTNSSAPEKLPEMRNEKIDWDTATIDLKDEKSGMWMAIPFGKEKGEWKFAVDKLRNNIRASPN